AAEHGDLGALAGLAGSSTNLHGAVVNFGHFHFKQALNESRVRARDDDLRPLGRAIHHANDDTQTLANVVGFELGLFAFRQSSFGAAHVDDQIRAFGTFYDYGDELADAIVILVVDRVALGLAHLLQNDLLGGLRSDTAEHIRGLGDQNFGADFR